MDAPHASFHVRSWATGRVRPAPARGRRGPARCPRRTAPSSPGCRTRSGGRPARPACARTRRPSRSAPRNTRLSMHQRPADAGAEGDAQDVAVADAGAEPALRERGGVRVVVDDDRHLDPAASAPRAAARRARPGAARTARWTGRRRRTRPPRCRPPPRRTPRSGCRPARRWCPRRRGRCGRGWPATAGQHGAERVDDAAEHLGAADVDADRQRAGPPDHRAARCRGGRARACSRDYGRTPYGAAMHPLRRTAVVVLLASRRPSWSPHPGTRATASRRPSAG